jgi:hypothetical protein
MLLKLHFQNPYFLRSKARFNQMWSNWLLKKKNQLMENIPKAFITIQIIMLPFLIF